MEQPEQCNSGHLDLCVTLQDCTEADGFWYHGACNAERISLSYIIFPDDNLAACVNESGFSWIDEVASLTCSEKNIENISGVEQLTNLENLDLSYNNISEISALANLTYLSKLKLYANNINDIGPLANLVNLTVLNLHQNPINDVSSLANLTNLTFLDLGTQPDPHRGGGRISDIGSLINLTHLSYLNLKYSSISDLQVLANLTNLEVLDLSYCHYVGDISPLANLKNITILNLKENIKLSDIRALSSLTSLAELDLSYCKISDISSLLNLTNLTFLDLTNNWDILCSDLDFIAAMFVEGVTMRLPYLYCTAPESQEVCDSSHLANCLTIEECQAADGVWFGKSCFAERLAVSNINFDDENLAACVNSYDYTWAHEVLELDCSNRDIINVSGLDHLLNLLSLDLRDNEKIHCSDLDALQTILGDGVIERSSCDEEGGLALLFIPFEDDFFESCVKSTGYTWADEITTLRCSDSEILSIIGVEYLVNLSEVDLSSNLLSDISPLTDLNLDRLELGGNRILDISPQSWSGKFGQVVK